MDNANVGYSYHLPSGGWNYKIRTTLSQFSDLFSEFNKYIAPAYHHDRCERSVPMRIYSMHKGECVMVFFVFFAIYGLGIFIGLAGPPPTMTTSMTASSVITNASTMYEGPYHLHSPALGTRAQRLWLFVEILTDNDDEEIFDKSFQVSISIEGVLENHSTTSIVSQKDAPNRTQHLKCKKRKCDELQVLHIALLKYTHYVLNVNFNGLKEFHKRYFIRDVIFYFKTYNPGFTQLELYFRFTFVITCFFAVLWFLYSLRHYHRDDWTLEQRWVLILMVSLMFANEPTYPLRLLAENRFATLMSDTSMILFLGTMMLSWLELYHGIRQNNRPYTKFYLMKQSVVLVVVMPAFVMSYWQKYVCIYDPTYNYRLNWTYPIMKAIFFSSLTIYFLYLLILILKAYSDLRNMPYFNSRLRCTSLMLGTVVTVITILAFQGWGPAALQDHWASEPQTHFDSSAPFMAMLGLFNFKLYVLAYLFSPGGKVVHEMTITKDNPAFSMINDSDEDVIYGSDEESRQPLNSHHKITDEDI